MSGGLFIRNVSGHSARFTSQVFVVTKMRFSDLALAKIMQAFSRVHFFPDTASYKTASNPNIRNIRASRTRPSSQTKRNTPFTPFDAVKFPWARLAASAWHFPEIALNEMPLLIKLYVRLCGRLLKSPARIDADGGKPFARRINVIRWSKYRVWAVLTSGRFGFQNKCALHTVKWRGGASSVQSDGDCLRRSCKMRATFRFRKRSRWALEI